MRDAAGHRCAERRADAGLDDPRAVAADAVLDDEFLRRVIDDAQERPVQIELLEPEVKRGIDLILAVAARRAGDRVQRAQPARVGALFLFRLGQRGKLAGRAHRGAQVRRGELERLDVGVAENARLRGGDLDDDRLALENDDRNDDERRDAEPRAEGAFGGFEVGHRIAHQG